MLDTIYLVTQIYFKLHFLRENKDNMVKILTYFSLYHPYQLKHEISRDVQGLH